MLVSLAVEDTLSESVARRLIGEYAPSAEIANVAGLAGVDSVQRQIPRLNQIARSMGPVLALVDLDRPSTCPGNLVRNLSGSLTIDPQLLIRVAVLEIESWIIADREGIAGWLSISASIVPRDPESLDDPKRAFVNLARRCRNRSLREAISPRQVIGTHRTGPGYNQLVGDFVRHVRNPDAARRNSPSLDRAINRIAELAAG